MAATSGLPRLRLGVNIDHVATIRNARGGEHPDPVRATQIVAQFGADAAEFNPHRQLPATLPPYGITFGVGIHTCLGRNLAAGDLAKPTTDPETHQYGTITLIARALIANNVRPDPANAPKREPNIAREAWAVYPVLLGPA